MTVAATSEETLRKAGDDVRPTRYLDYRAYLQDLYLYIKETRGRYSYLQFAEDLGFSQTNVLHLIIRGKRRLSVRAAERILDALGVRGSERQYLELLVQVGNARLPSERERHFARLMAFKNRTLTSALEKSQLEYYSEWYHPVIREMVAMPGFVADPVWISSRIHPRVLPEQVRKSLALLQTLGLVRLDPQSGKLLQTSPHVTTGDEIVSHAVVRYHQKTMEIARDSLTGIHSDRRDVSAVTVCVSESVATRMRDEIQAFRKKLLALADESEDADQIYQVNIQLFPFTK